MCYLLYLRANARIRFRLTLNEFFSSLTMRYFTAKQFKYYVDCSVTLYPSRVKIALCELHNTLSVKALQWRSAGTTSFVLLLTVD